MKDVAAMTFPELIEAIKLCEQTTQLSKQSAALLDAELTRRTQSIGTQLLEGAGKDHGSVSFEHEGVALKADARKVVKWDNDKLRAIAATLPWATVEKVFDIKFSVPERIYSALVDDVLLAKLNEARTTKVDPLKVTLAK